MRHVVIEVDDDLVRRLAVTHYADEPYDGAPWDLVKDEIVPVPQDDQFARDQRRAVQALIDSSMMYTQLGDRQEPRSEAEAVYREQAQDDIMAARRLRAAFNLDTGGE